MHIDNVCVTTLTARSEIQMFRTAGINYMYKYILCVDSRSILGMDGSEAQNIVSDRTGQNLCQKGVRSGGCSEC